MKIKIFDILISNSCSLIIILVLDNLGILLTEQSLLKFNRLSIRTSQFLDLIVKSSNCLLNLVSLSKSSVKLSVGLFNCKNLLIDGITEHADSIVVLTLFTVKDLKAKFLIFNFLFTTALITFKLENVILLLFLDIMVICNLTVESLNISS